MEISDNRILKKNLSSVNLNQFRSTCWLPDTLQTVDVSQCCHFRLLTIGAFLEFYFRSGALGRPLPLKKIFIAMWTIKFFAPPGFLFFLFSWFNCYCINKSWHISSTCFDWQHPLLISFALFADSASMKTQFFLIGANCDEEAAWKQFRELRPFFSTILKHSLWWHFPQQRYLKTVTKRPTLIVTLESQLICCVRPALLTGMR